MLRQLELHIMLKREGLVGEGAEDDNSPSGNVIKRVRGEKGEWGGKAWATEYRGRLITHSARYPTNC